MLTLIVNKDIFGFEIAIDNTKRMEMLQTQSDLRGVESRPTLGESWSTAHIVNVELQIPAIHDRQHEAEGVFRLEGVRQAHLEVKASKC